MIRFLPAARVAVLLAVSPLVLLSPSALGAEDALGRLFFTPERRQQLDRQREMNVPDHPAPSDEPTVTVDGVVTRSSGKRTAWVNGKPQNDNDVWSGLSVTPRRGDPGRVVVKAGDLPAASARVGETINRSTGEASDPLNGGRIRVDAQARTSR